MADSNEQDNEIRGSVKCGKILNELCDYQLLDKVSKSCSTECGNVKTVLCGDPPL